MVDKLPGDSSSKLGKQKAKPIIIEKKEAAGKIPVSSCANGVKLMTPSAKKPIIPAHSRINPNNASAAGLMLLPGIGPARAQAIISYREQFRQNYPGESAFRNCNDLDNVKGIGPVTISNMCKYLKF